MFLARLQTALLTLSSPACLTDGSPSLQQTAACEGLHEMAGAQILSTGTGWPLQTRPLFHDAGAQACTFYAVWRTCLAVRMSLSP